MAPHSENPDAQLTLLTAQRQLNDATDETLEVALRERLALGKTMTRVLPLLGEYLGATAAHVRTYNENLELADFTWNQGEQSRPPIPIQAVMRAANDSKVYYSAESGGAVVGQRIDVAGESFGVAAVRFDHAITAEDRKSAELLLDTWCEELDNYLAGIAMARRKHQLITALSDALRDRVLDEGVNRAIEVIRTEVGFSDMIMVYRHDTAADDGTIVYKVIRDNVTVADSEKPTGHELEKFVTSQAEALHAGEISAVAEGLGIGQFREEVMITGALDDQVLGRVIVSRGEDEFNTFDRDLLERFVDFLRQRVVDFNREWRHLSLCFPRDSVRRLLHAPGYAAEYLTPREHDVAILYCDISGFTRVSEQVLKTPELIGKLINTWSARVVDIVWETGGVFDKMVGDCIIGLWGPPFYDFSPQEAAARAADAAMRIRDFTRTLGASEELPELRDMGDPVGVATGLNFCPLFVGQFGPNENFTGFSSGMNNTARLQGVAVRDEILCMGSFVSALGDRAEFGDQREAQVKNVAEPLEFRPLKRLIG